MDYMIGVCLDRKVQANSCRKILEDVVDLNSGNCIAISDSLLLNVECRMDNMMSI